MPLQVLYEDNHLIAVYKPAGVLVQGDETGDPTLMDEVKYYLKTKYHKTGKVFLGLVHRLDRPVSGIILFAKTSKGASRLSEQMRNHEIEKVYHALVIGTLKKKKNTLVHFLEKNPNSNVVKVFEKEKAGTLRAELSYDGVETHCNASLHQTVSILKIHLKTGRPHQIRAQLSAIGHPIVGDVKYGGPVVETRRASSLHEICLCATSLSFTTATGDERKTIEIDIPKEWKI